MQTKNRKILMFFEDLDSMGGAQKHVKYLGKELKKLNFDVYVIARNIKNLAKVEEKPYGHVIRFKGIFNTKIFNHFINIFNSFTYSLKALKEIKKIHPNIIHVHTYFPPAIITFFQSFFLKIPYILTLHLGETVDFPDIVERFFKIIIKRAKNVIAVSNEIKTIQVSFGNPSEKIKIIRNGVDRNFFYKRTYVDEELPFNLKDKQTNKIITIRRLAKKNGIDYLIRAFKEVLNELPNTRLFIGGTGEEYEKLVKLTQDLGVDTKVDFLGYIPEKKLPAYYSASDIYVSSSLAEGFSLAILEALACECPSIMTKAGDTYAVLPKSAIYVKPGDIPALSRAMIDLLSSAALRRSLIESSRKEIIPLTWESISKKIIKEYLSK